LSITSQQKLEGLFMFYHDEFSDFISEQDLMDLPLVGVFARSISHDPLMWSRINRFLVCPEWEALFPGVSQEATTPLLRSLSYHS
jgi:hypothetical protein